MNIVVVESPAKAKTINQYLGNDYKVLASYGHIRDLPNKKGSVIPDDNFLMKYEVQDDKKKQISAISKSITKGDTLWLATDADREGEAIAWHIHSFLKEKNKTEEILKLAVKRMLPGGPLAKKQLTKLKIYNGDIHPHEVQKPKIIEFAKLNKRNIIK